MTDHDAPPESPLFHGESERRTGQTTDDDPLTTPLEPQPGPPGRQGDALETGTGSRQGVHRRDARPDTCEPEPPEHAAS